MYNFFQNDIIGTVLSSVFLYTSKYVHFSQFYTDITKKSPGTLIFVILFSNGVNQNSEYI